MDIQVHVLKELNARTIAFIPIYVRLMGSVAGALALSQLMYWFRCKDKRCKRDEDILSETMLTPNEWRGVKKKLKEIPFLKITREGTPAKTYYEIDWTQYQVTMNGLEQISEINESRLAEGGSIRENHESRFVKSTNLTTNIEKNNISEPSDEGNRMPSETPFQKQKRHPRWLKFAKKLHNAVLPHTNIDRTRHLHQWANSIRLLHTSDKVPTRRIRLMLDWYCGELAKGRRGSDFLPEAFSGATFKEKFLNIERAKAREEKKTGDGFQSEIPPDAVFVRKASKS